MPDAGVHYQWMLLLPSTTVHTMCVFDWCCVKPHPEFIATIVRCPALGSVRHLTLRGFIFSSSAHEQNGDIVFHEGAKIESFMSLPALRSLCIDAEFVVLRTPTAHFARLKRLSITTYSPNIRPIVQELRESLVQLDVSIRTWDYETVMMLADDLVTLSQLRHLSIFQDAEADPPSLNVPFMDDVVEKLIGLETLYCCRNSFTGRLISSIPPSLRTLRLETWRPYVEGIMLACIRRKAGESDLQLLKMGSYESRCPSPPPSPEMSGLCEAAGISLEALEHEHWLKVLCTHPPCVTCNDMLAPYVP